MLWSRFILILMIALVSARPSPELSLEEIEKELEQLTAKENDASDATSIKTNDQATSTKEDAAKKSESEVPKELAEKTREVPIETLETLEKTVTETEQTKDASTETKADTDKKATDTSADPAAKSSKELSKLVDFKDTPAYRRLMESSNSHYPRPAPAYPRTGYMKYDRRLSYPLPNHPQIPARRTYDAGYRKNYDRPPFYNSDDHRRGFVAQSDPIEVLRRLSADRAASDENRGGFLPNPDSVESLRGLPSDMTRAERVALSSGSWNRGSRPVKVPAKLPLPVNPGTAVRSYNDVHKQLNDNETEDLIHGKDGLTDAEKRKRYLIDLLAEKLKSKVADAQKRGVKVPDKIMDFIWNYESRRGMDTKAAKHLLSH